MRNQKGEGEAFFAVAALGVVGAIYWAATTTVQTHNRPTPRPQAYTTQVKKLKPACDEKKQCKGAYVYKSTSGDYWTYYFLMNDVTDTSSVTDQGSRGTSYGSYGSTLPPGGTWSRSTQPPAEEEVIAQEAVDVPTAGNEPLTNEQLEVYEAQAEAAEAQSQATEAAESQAEAASASDTGSTSSDSGSSGGDSGGDGGGGGSD